MNQLKIYLFITFTIFLIIPHTFHTKSTFPGIICDNNCYNLCLKHNTNINLLELCMKNCLCKNKINSQIIQTTGFNSKHSLKNLSIFGISLIFMILIGFYVFKYLNGKSGKSKLYHMLKTEEKESKLIEI